MLPNQVQTPLKRQETPFEKMVRTKKVFKIEKDLRPVQKPLNIKRRASAPLEEEMLPMLKQVKSQPNHFQNLAENKVFFSFNLPMKQTSPVRPNLSNYFNVFEDRQAYNNLNQPNQYSPQYVNKAAQVPAFQFGFQPY